MSADFADLHRLFPGRARHSVRAALSVVGVQGTARPSDVGISGNLRNLQINF
jgi:hypothetical protein